MNAVIDVGFDYSTLDVSGRDEVREAAVRIRLRMARTASDIVEIGRDLLLVKERVGHGGFIRWIEAEFGMSDRSANRFMQVATRFKSATVADLKPSVVYALAEPGATDEVVEQVVARAAAGEPVTRDDVKELKRQLGEYKEKARGAKATERDVLDQLETLQAELARLRDEKHTLEAELSHTATRHKEGGSVVSLAERPLNDIEAYEKWLAEGVRWISRGSAEWRERAQPHIFPDHPVMPSKWA